MSLAFYLLAVFGVYFAVVKVDEFIVCLRRIACALEKRNRNEQ